MALPLSLCSLVGQNVADLASTDLDRPTVFSPVDARNECREERGLLRPLTFSGHAKARAFLALLRLVTLYKMDVGWNIE